MVDVQPVEQFTQGDLQRSGDTGQHIQAGASSPSLYPADVGPVEFGTLSQCLLRQLPLEAQLLHALAKRSTDIHRRSSCENGQRPTIDDRL